MADYENLYSAITIQKYILVAEYTRRKIRTFHYIDAFMKPIGFIVPGLMV